jgi:hypothetical protein
VITNSIERVAIVKRKIAVESAIESIDSALAEGLSSVLPTIAISQASSYAPP